MFTRKEFLAPACDFLLIPFYLTVAIFFLFIQPFTQLPEETITNAFFKILPILSLAGYVYMKRVHQHGYTDDPHVPSVFLSFVLSTFGDIGMLFRSTIRDLGVLVFTFSHYIHMVGLKQKPLCKDRRTDYIFLYLLLALFLTYQGGVDSLYHKFGMIVYYGTQMIIAAMATRRFRQEKSVPALWGMVAFCIYIPSDWLIGFETFYLETISLEFIVMILYYSAQFCIALSTVVTKPDVEKEKEN